MMPRNNGGKPDQFSGQWNGQAQPHLPIQVPQQQQQQQQQQQSQMNALRLQQQMMMMHQSQHPSQLSGDHFHRRSNPIGGVPGSQMMGQPRNVAMNDSSAIHPAVMMNQGQTITQGMKNPLGQGPAAGVGGISASDGMMGKNSMPNNAALLLGMQQQFQQQAGAGVSNPHLPGGLRNPMMGGGVFGGAAAANIGAGFNPQAQNALYWSALQASGMANQQQLGQQGQVNPRGQPGAGQPGVPIADGVGSSQLWQQVGATVEFQNSVKNAFPSEQAQLPPQNQDVAQRQESQTQLLVQQQCLILRLQQQLQQQQHQQPGNNAGILPSQVIPGQQLRQWNTGAPGAHGAEQKVVTSNNSSQHPRVLGDFPARSCSVGSALPRCPSQPSSQNLKQSQAPQLQGPMQDRRNSLGSAMNAHQQKVHQQTHQLSASMFADAKNLQREQSSQQTECFREHLGVHSQQSLNQPSINHNTLKPPSQEPSIVSHDKVRTALTEPFHREVPLSLRTPTTLNGVPAALDGVWRHSTPQVISNQLPNQQIKEILKHPSMASTSTMERVHAQAQLQESQQAQEPQQKQQQSFLTHVLQKQLHEGGNTSSLQTTISGLRGVPESAKEKRESSAPEATLDKRGNQFQAVQHSRQFQDQLKLVGGWGRDSSLGNHQQLGQLQAQVSKSQQDKYHQRRNEALPTDDNGGTFGGYQQAHFAINPSKDSHNAFTNEPSSINWNPNSNSLSPLRDFQRSSSQGSSFSPTSFNLIDPDPIAEGFNTALGGVVRRGSSASSDRVNSGDGQQSFLDGHFAGGWQSNADLPDRRRINFHIIKVIERIRPDANRMSQNRLPLMAKKLEEHLYRSARSKEEYVDPATLKFRLHLIAKGGGILKPDDDEYGVEIRDDISGGSVISKTSSGAHSQGLETKKDANKMNSASSNNNNHQALTVNLSRAPENYFSDSRDVGVPFSDMLLRRMMDQTAGSPTTQKDSFVSGTQDVRIPGQEMTKEMVIQQQLRLLLLRHTSKCTSGPSCRTQYCPQMITVWKHLKRCRNNSCKIPHCLSSRCVLNHYRKCKRDGKLATCAICGPVMIQSGENRENGGTGRNQNDMSADEFDKFVFGNESQELTGPLDDMISFPEDSTIDDNLYDSVMKQLVNIEPLDPFASHTQTKVPKRMFGGEPIPQDPVLSPMAQIPQRSVVVTQAGQSEILGDMQTQPQSQLQNDNGCSILELQKELDKKQLFSQMIQEQKANLYGQNRKLQQKLTLASNMQQAQQLQKEQAICEQIHEQYQQQQLIINGDIQRIVSLMQQERDQQGIRLASDKQVNTCAPDNATFKRSADQIDGVEPLNKKPAGVNYCLSLEGKKEGADADLPSDESEVMSSSQTLHVPFQLISSVIPFMSVADIESHLDSLVGNGQLAPRYISRKCLPLVKRLINHEHGWVFKDPVDPVELGIPDYFKIIENPMDLTLVANKLEDGAYKDLASFERDTKLVFENAIQFNGEDSAVGVMAIELLEVFDAEIKNITKGSMVEKDTLKKRGNSCSLCGNHRRVFNPPDLLCSGSCGMQKIRRNATYFTDSFKQNHWCEHCYTHRLKDDELIQLDDGRVTTKSLLIKSKNDSTPEESWVQCDQCHDWNHQICALFNGLQNAKVSSFSCPKCFIKDARENGKQERTGYKGASELPHCNLSRSIEQGLTKTLSKVYEKVAKDRSCTVAQVEKVEALNVRVVSSVKKKQKVREAMVAKYSVKGYPTVFIVTTKCIVLFQKIHGVDVLVFGMFVYEYGADCEEPNRRRVYISYLDSVRYLEPSSYRTIAYQSVIIEYLRFVKMRGFHTAHIWSCPPAKGDEYIFHCHPTHQLTPNDDLLCAWYIEMLTKAKEEGVVLKTRTLYDEYFKNAANPKTGRMYDPTSLPYFDGDYIPGEIEKIIKDLNQDELKREETKLKAPKLTFSHTQTEGKRVGTRSNPGEIVDQSRDKVMNRLDLVLSRMKKNFMVVQLLSDDFIEAVEKGADLSLWAEIVEPKGKNPIPTSGNSATGSAILEVTADTIDHDPSMEQDCIDTRLQFLNYCQRNNYQFDELRRAKHSTMMLLAALHKPRAEQDQQIRTYLQLVFHASTCPGTSACSSSNCQRMQQLFKHVKGCDVTYKRGCKVCTRLFILLTRHARDCILENCPVPYCDLIKERTRLLAKQQQMIDDRRRDAQNDRIVHEGGVSSGD